MKNIGKIFREQQIITKYLILGLNEKQKSVKVKNYWKIINFSQIEIFENILKVNELG